MTDNVFDKAIGLCLEVSVWSGAKKLKDEDFQGVELPPEDLVSLGSKRIHDKQALKPLQVIRTKAVTALENLAVSLYGGRVWIVPADRLDEIESTLAMLADEFQAEKDRFLQNFYDQQQKWLEQNRKWACILEPYLETPQTVEKKFVFRWRTFKMTSVQEDDRTEASVSDDMSCALVKEMSVLAAESYQTLKDRDRATPKNLNRLDRLASKLKGLAFVTPGVSVIEQELTRILDSRDGNGVLSGHEVFALTRLLVQLKDPGILNEVLDAARNGSQYQFAHDAVQTPGGSSEPSSRSRSRPSNLQRLPDTWF